MTLAEEFFAVAARWPDRIAIADEARAWSFAELERAVTSIAGRLARGSVVIASLPSGAEFTAVQLATLAAGGTFVPVSTTMPRPRLLALAEALRPDLLILPPGGTLPGTALFRVAALAPDAPAFGLPSTRPDPQPALADTALMQLTSGTTGEPKAILISESSLAANHRAALAAFAPSRAAPDRRVFSALPQSHAMGNAVVLEYLLAGASVYVSRGFLPGADLALIDERACTDVVATPTWARLMLRLGARLRPETQLTLGSDAAEPDLRAQLRAASDHLELVIRYGLSESVGALTRLVISPGTPLPPPGLVGVPALGVELALGPSTANAPEREIRARGAQTAHAIWQDGASFALRDADGFIGTGDVGDVDDDGVWRVRGRRSTFIKSGGHRIEPLVVETAIRGFAAVRDVAVVGVPDPLSGQRVGAAVEADATLPTAQLLAHCARHLAPHERPRRIVRVDRLPRTVSGKPDLRKVIDLLREA